MKLAVLALLTGCSSLLGLDKPLLLDASTRDATIDAPRDSGGPELCPADYTINYGQSRYRYATTTLATWLGALSDCANDSAGTSGRYTHLVVITDDMERTSFATFSTGAYWIGLSDRLTEGDYRWVTNEPTNGYPALQSGAWGTGQPDDAGGTQDCIATIKDSDATFEDMDCGAGFAYLCECDGYPSTPPM